MDSINEKIFNANIQLQDENKVLKQDKKILQKRMDNAIEVLNDNSIEVNTACRMAVRILKGEYVNER